MRHEPAALVAVVAGGKVVATASPGVTRPDVAAALGEPRLLEAGYAVALARAAAGGDGARLRVFAVSQGLEAAELTPAGGVAVPARPDRP